MSGKVACMNSEIFHICLLGDIVFSQLPSQKACSECSGVIPLFPIRYTQNVFGKEIIGFPVDEKWGMKERQTDRRQHLSKVTREMKASALQQNEHKSSRCAKTTSIIVVDVAFGRISDCAPFVWKIIRNIQNSNFKIPAILQN